MDSTEVRRLVRSMLRQDRDAGRLKSVARYLRCFPGFASVVEAEYADVAGGRDHGEAHASDSGRSESAPGGGSSPPDAGPDAAATAPVGGATGEIDAQEGRRRARYEDLGEVARGAVGAILRVRDVALRRDLAMKVLLTQRPGSRHALDSPPAAELRRFLDEAQITAQLDHPGVVPVHELGTDAEGRVFFTMKLVRGRTLAEVLARHRTGDPAWPANAVLGVFAKVLDTLAFAHDKGVVHRDVKPENVMVGDFGEVYLMDWGLARTTGARADDANGEEAGAGAVATDTVLDPRMTSVGQILGTPAYMSPEQAEGAEVDARADVYAVGAMLYEFLCGRHPYAGGPDAESVLQIVLAIRRGPPDPVARLAPRAPPELAAIVTKAMARRREDRYASALDLGRDLRSFLDGRVVHAYRSGPWTELRKWVGRNRATAAALAAALAAMAAGLVASLILAAEARRGEREATRQLYRVGVTAAAAEIAANNVAGAHLRLASLPAQLNGWERRNVEGRLERSLFVRLAWGYLVREDGCVVLVEFPSGDVHEVDPVAGRVVRAAVMAGRGLAHGCGAGFMRTDQTAGPYHRSLVSPATGEVLHSFDVDGGADPPADARWFAWTWKNEVRTFDADTRIERSWPAKGRIPLATSHSARRAAMQRTTPASPIEVVDADTGTVLATTPATREAAVAGLSADGGLLAVGDGRTLVLYDVSQPEPVCLWRSEGQTDRIRCVVFSRDGRRIATGSSARVVHLLDVATGRTQRVLAGHGDSVLTAAFTPDGTRLVSLAAGGEVRIWDVSADHDPEVLSGHASYVYEVAFTPDGRRVVSAGWDGYTGSEGAVRVWDAESGDPVAAWGPRDRIVESIAVSRDGRRIYSVGRSSTDGWERRRFDVWDADTGERLPTPDTAEFGTTLSPDGRLLVRAVRTGLRVQDAATLDVVRDVPHAQSEDFGAAQTAFSPDGTLFAAAAERGGVRILRTDDWTEVARAKVPSCLAAGICFDRAGERLFVPSSDHLVHVFDSATGRELAPMVEHGNNVFDVAASPDAQRLFSAGSDGRILVWDATTCEQIAELPGHTSYVHRLALSPDGETLASASGDSTVRLWRTRPFLDAQRASVERRRLVDEFTPHVRARLDAGVSATDAAAEIRADGSLSERGREVALQVVLAEAISRRAAAGK